jgi:hypothetical protein
VRRPAGSGFNPVATMGFPLTLDCTSTVSRHGDLDGFVHAYLVQSAGNGGRRA